MSELDEFRGSLHRATADLMPPPDIAERVIGRGVRVRRRRRATALAGTGVLAAAAVVGAMALVPRHTAQIVPVAPASTAPACPQGRPVSCGIGWPARGPRAGDHALLERALKADPGPWNSPYVLWAGDLPDGRTFLLYEVTNARGFTSALLYLERAGRREMPVSNLYSTDDTFWTFVGSTQRYLVAIGPPGTTRIQFATTGQPMVDAVVTDGLAVLPVSSKAATDGVSWRYRVASQPWSSPNTAIYQPLTEASPR